MMREMLEYIVRLYIGHVVSLSLHTHHLLIKMFPNLERCIRTPTPTLSHYPFLFAYG